MKKKTYERKTSHTNWNRTRDRALAHTYASFRVQPQLLRAAEGAMCAHNMLKFIVPAGATATSPHLRTGLQLLVLTISEKANGYFVPCFCWVKANILWSSKSRSCQLFNVYRMGQIAIMSAILRKPVYPFWNWNSEISFTGRGDEEVLCLHQHEPCCSVFIMSFKMAAWFSYRIILDARRGYL